MNTRDRREYRRRYQRFHHHAWAGSIMLSLLLALRIFLEISDVDVDDWIFLPVGVILLGYTLTALFYTYRYREGLEAGEATSDEVEQERIRADVETERIATAAAQRQAELEAETRQAMAEELAKARKKEAEALAKTRKKEAKEAAKARKKAEKAAEKARKKEDS
ncbi:MAG: hypothetical protein R6U10_03155 [Thermoplasmatota archaeon]